MQEIISFLKFLATSNTINFILMLMILGWIIKKANLGKSFDESILLVESGIKKSDEEKQNSKEKLDEAKALMDRLPEDVKALEENSSQKVDVFCSQIEENAQKTISGLGQNIDRAISVEEQKISNLLTGKTSAASVELAREYMKNLLKDNQDLHNKFIQESLDELDKVEL